MRPDASRDVTTNFGRGPVELPAGEVLLASSALEGGKLPPDATAWVAR